MTTGVGENGRFLLAPVPPGTYRLCAWEDIENAWQYNQGYLATPESNCVRLTVKEYGREQIILRQIPSARGPQ